MEDFKLTKEELKHLSLVYNDEVILDALSWWAEDEPYNRDIINIYKPLRERINKHFGINTSVEHHHNIDYSVEHNNTESSCPNCHGNHIKISKEVDKSSYCKFTIDSLDNILKDKLSKFININLLNASIYDVQLYDYTEEIVTSECIDCGYTDTETNIASGVIVLIDDDAYKYIDAADRIFNILQEMSPHVEYCQFNTYDQIYGYTCAKHIYGKGDVSIFLVSKESAKEYLDDKYTDHTLNKKHNDEIEKIYHILHQTRKGK